MKVRGSNLSKSASGSAAEGRPSRAVGSKAIGRGAGSQRLSTGDANPLPRLDFPSLAAYRSCLARALHGRLF